MLTGDDPRAEKVARRLYANAQNMPGIARGCRRPVPENDDSHQAARSPFADAAGKLGSLRNGELTMDNELDVRLGRLEAAIRSQGEQQERVLVMLSQLVALMQEPDDQQLPALLTQLVAAVNANSALLERIDQALERGVAGRS